MNLVCGRTLALVARVRCFLAPLLWLFAGRLQGDRVATAACRAKTEAPAPFCLTPRPPDPPARPQNVEVDSQFADPTARSTGTRRTKDAEASVPQGCSCPWESPPQRAAGTVSQRCCPFRFEYQELDSLRVNGAGQLAGDGLLVLLEFRTFRPSVTR